VTIIVLLVVGMLAVSGVMSVDPEVISRHFGWVLIAVTVGFFAWLFVLGRWTADERKSLVIITVLFLAAVVFWMAYEQAGSTLNLFAQRSTDNRVLGHAFPASWYQSLPPLFIIIFAPVFAAIWLRLGRRNPSSPTKFAIALVLLGGGFGLMIGAATLAQTGVRVSPLWLVLSYLLQTLGELCLSPVGLSAVSTLAPVRIAGLVMGVWFLALSVGNYLAGMASSFYEKIPLPRLFLLVTLTALGTALVLALLVRPIRRMLERA
jgi:POT family proton-dependent oligopeptide transporter